MNVTFGQPMILAAFVTPALLYAGLAAMAAPILIHLLSRRRLRRVPWAATRFLLEAHRQNRRRLRIEELILLALRCLAVALIGLLVARPFVAPRGWAAMIGAAEHTARIFVLDDSYSMGALDRERSRFDRARDALFKVLETVHRESPGDPVTIVLTSRPHRPLLSAAYLDEPRLADVRADLERLRPSHRAGLNDVFQAVAAELDEPPGTVNAAVYVFSDFQRRDWAGVDHQSDLDAGPLFPLAEWARREHSLSLHLQAVGRGPVENLAVVALDAGQPRFVAGIPGIVVAKVQNFGAALKTNVQVGLSVDDVVQPGRTVPRIDPGATLGVPLEVMMIDPGPHEVRVSLSGDALVLDNTRQMTIHAGEAVRVLVVNGEPAAESIRDETHLLATALQPEGPVASGNDVRVVDEVELADVELTRYNLVILANVYQVPPAAYEQLEAYAADGGGVVFWLGDQVDPALYNELYHRGGRGLFPLRLERDVQVPEASPGVNLTADQTSHPLTQVLSGEASPFRQRIHFTRYFSGTIDTTSGDTPEAPSEPRENGELDRARSREVVVLMRYADEARTPALVESRFGEGRVLVMTSSCDLEWNDWATNPGYVVTALEMARHAARRDDRDQGVLVGAPIRLRVDPAEFDPRATLLVPGANGGGEVEIPGEPAADGGPLEIHWDDTSHSGIYRFALTDRRGAPVRRPIAVNVDPTEGDLRQCDRGALEQRCAAVTDDYTVGDLLSAGARREAGRREVWPAVLIVLALTLMTEQLLARWFGARS